MSDTGASIGLGITTPDLPVLGSAQISARFQAALNVTVSPVAAQATTAPAPTGRTVALVNASAGAAQSGGTGQPRASDADPSIWRSTPSQAGTAFPRGGNEMVVVDAHTVAQATGSAGVNAGQSAGFTSPGDPQTWTTAASQSAGRGQEMVGLDSNITIQTTTGPGGNSGQPVGITSSGNPQTWLTTPGTSQAAGQENEMVGIDSQSVVQVENGSSGALGLLASLVMPVAPTAFADAASDNVTFGAWSPAPAGYAPVYTNLQASPDTTVSAQTVVLNTVQAAAVQFQVPADIEPGGAQAAVATPQPGETSIVVPNTTPRMTSPAALPAPEAAQAAAQPALAGLPTPGPSNPPPSAAAAQAADLPPATAAAPSEAQAEAAIAAPQMTAAPPAGALPAAPANIGVTALPTHGHAANPPLATSVLLPSGILLSPVLRNTKGQPPYRRRPQAANPELTRQKTAHGGSAARVVSYTDRRTIPLDLVPATPQATCWRIDETAALVAVGGTTVDERAAARRATALHSALFEADPLAALGTGEGLSTWEGSPLWLRLAGIAKPASLGVLPMEAAPCWIEIMRVEPELFSVVLSRGAWLAPRITLHPSGSAFLRALRTDLLYGVPPDPSGLAALESTARFAPPHAWRAQEAWAALLRAQAREASRRLAGVPATPITTAEARLGALLLAGDPIPPANGRCDRVTLLAVDDADFAGLLGAYGNFVLARLSEGDMTEFDSLDGLVLAQRLGRTLRPALLEASA